jgi:DNA-binding MarR family transcriptional regulator
MPLPTLLSHALVAFTIEFDNEFEHRTPHWTTNQTAAAGSREGPWLASMVMWLNCMQFVGEEGVRVGELADLARTRTNLNGMERWGYITIKPDPADASPKPRARWMIRATSKGRKAQEVWRPLFAAIEERWQERFGKEQIEQLREALSAVIARTEIDLPDCLPILGYGLFSRGPNRERRAPAAREDGSLHLSALLSRVLLAFAIEFERESELSLAINANVVRVLDENGVRIRDLPLLSGVSKEAIRMALGVLEKKRVVVIEPEQAGSRVKVARLTAKGVAARDAYRQRLGNIEEQWQSRFGKDTIRKLRKLLEGLVGEPNAERSPLFRGLEPYPDGWRASVKKPSTLPHYPMVLHRGGFPDGS